VIPKLAAARSYATGIRWGVWHLFK